MHPVRVGILGTGTIVRDFHLPALMANPRARVVALGNLHPASLSALAHGHRIEKVYTDFDLMARDREIDAVVNALPNALHAPVTVQMLQGGKHVLCEKPMARDVLEARDMAAAARAAGRKLMIAHVWRSDADVRRLREGIGAGRLGTTFRVRGHAVVAGRGPAPGSWFVQPDLAGGGALADVGIHAIDTISFLFRDRVRPVQVWARIGTYFQPIAVEDTATAVVEYDNGMVAEIEAGWSHPYAESPHGTIELFGTEGSARTLPLRWRDRGEGDGNSSRALTSADDSHIQPTMYQAQIDHFLDCVLDDREPVCDARQGLWSMMVLEAAYRSARERSTVAIDPSAALVEGVLQG
jgi:predicted dehydrogenase